MLDRIWSPNVALSADVVKLDDLEIGFEKLPLFYADSAAGLPKSASGKGGLVLEVSGA